MSESLDELVRLAASLELTLETARVKEREAKGDYVTARKRLDAFVAKLVSDAHGAMEAK